MASSFIRIRRSPAVGLLLACLVLVVGLRLLSSYSITTQDYLERLKIFEEYIPVATLVSSSTNGSANLVGTSLRTGFNISMLSVGESINNATPTTNILNITTPTDQQQPQESGESIHNTITATTNHTPTIDQQPQGALALGAALRRPHTTNLLTGPFQKSPTLPTPILVVSLPKSGTTATTQYFKCGGAVASHTYVNAPTKNNNTHRGYSMRSGICIHQNYVAGAPLLEGCQSPSKQYTVYSDVGYYDQIRSKCFYPSIHALDQVYESYPNATLLLFRRNVTSWYQSVIRYGRLLRKWNACQLGGPYYNTSNESQEAYFTRLYTTHRKRLYDFVNTHPSLTYYEFSLESNETGMELQRITGIQASCWKQIRPARR